MDKDKYIGRLLDGRYEILEVIGTGGMAVVYKARCHRLNRLVAIKILKDEYSQDEEFRRRFYGESQAVAMLSHPNIVSVYDVSSSDDMNFIVMELIDGITLKQYMEKKGVLNWKETLHFAIQIAKALEHAHGRGIVHRDIKPHNVMVLKNGSVKVADFGIAQVMSQNSNTLTKEALGSVHYISPEQARGGRVDNRSDIYSLGIVMYEMISGRVPFDGDSPVAVAIQHINGSAALPSTLNPNFPKGLEQIIMKAMCQDVKGRYPTATAMLYDMDEFRKDPTKVFARKTEPVDGATRVLPANLEQELERQPSKTIAQQTAEKVDPPRPRREKRVQEQRGKRIAEDEEEEDDSRSRVTTVAVIACSVVAVIAVVIFMMLWIYGGGFTPKTQMVQVPSLIGQNIETLREYDGIIVVRQGSAHSSRYEKGQITHQEPAAGIYVTSGSRVFVTVSLGEEPPAKTMEDLVDLNADEAERFLKGLNIGLNVIRREETSPTVAAGNVTRTNPEAGAPLSEGQTITIWVSKGRAVIMADMPNVVGCNVETAMRILNENGFTNVHRNPVDSDRPKDEVVGQSVERFTKVDVTTAIVLDVSTGVPEMTLPPSEPTSPSESVPPSDPSEPDIVTEPSEPSDGTEPADPSEPTETEGSNAGEVTIPVFFPLPSRTESYILSIQLDGEWVVSGVEIAPGSTGWTVELTGSGLREYVLFINGEEYTTQTVDFGTNE